MSQRMPIGTVFKIDLDENHWGYGQVVESDGTGYRMVAFSTISTKDVVLEVGAVAASEVAFAPNIQLLDNGFTLGYHTSIGWAPVSPSIVLTGKRNVSAMDTGLMVALQGLRNQEHWRNHYGEMLVLAEERVLEIWHEDLCKACTPTQAIAKKNFSSTTHWSIQREISYPMGSSEERNDCLDAEDDLELLLKQSGLDFEVDGHEYGGGEFLIYLSGTAKAGEVRKSLKKWLKDNPGYLLTRGE